MKIYGKHAVRTALESGRPFQRLWLAKSLNPQVITEFQTLAQARGVQAQLVSFAKLDVMFPNANTQGVVGDVEEYRYFDWQDVLTQAQEKGETPFFILLDRIQDPHNLGAILRTADAAGVHGIIMPKHGSVSIAEGVIKASAGAIERVPVCQVTNLVRCMQDLQKAGLWLTGFAPEAEEVFTSVDLTGPVGLVIGAEHEGLRRQTRETCDRLVQIPMVARAASLNASVAAALGIYEVIRQRRLA